MHLLGFHSFEMEESVSYPEVQMEGVVLLVCTKSDFFPQRVLLSLASELCVIRRLTKQVVKIVG